MEDPCKRWFAIHVLAVAAASCTSPKPVNEERRQSSVTLALQQQERGEIGAECDQDGDCRPNHVCTNAGSCACAQGLVACGKKCVDVGSDDKNCGQCQQAYGQDVAP